MVIDQASALKAARQFVRSVLKSGIRLQAAYLYGSFAKGTAHAESDIDVALVSQDFDGWVDDLEKIRPALLTMDSRIEHVRIRPENFVDESPLVWEIKTTGIPLLPKRKNGKGQAARKRAPARKLKRVARAS